MNFGERGIRFSPWDIATFHELEVVSVPTFLLRLQLITNYKQQNISSKG